MRRVDWELQLHDYLNRCSSCAFAWGEHDCALFAAGGVLAMTGVDPAATFRGRYRTAIGSVRALRRYGTGTLEATIDALLPRKPIGFAISGDVVMVDGMAGICTGADAVFVGEADGTPQLLRFPRARWQAAWSV